MVIVLTNYEKKTFFSFLFLYIGSILLLIVVIANQFYHMNYKHTYDIVTSNMKMRANNIASDIIIKHMRGDKFNKKDYINNSPFRLELFNISNQPILYNIDENIDFSKSLYIKNKSIYLISDRSLGHLGIDKIVIKDNLFFKNNFIRETIIIFSLLFIFMSIIGYFLGKMFLKPILIQRDKLDRFIKDTTHELNTPITALLMSIHKKDITSANNIKRINLSAQRISEIYKDLTYIFLKEDKTLNDIIDLKHIFFQNINYFQELASKKKINLSCDIENIKFAIDKENFTRLTNNIISNAIKYTNINGNIEIKLKDNVFIVKDDGIGIPNKYQKDIFKRFYRATEHSGGFGIGLNIVSSICKKYNIKISLKSEENQGTIFKLFFQPSNIT